MKNIKGEMFMTNSIKRTEMLKGLGFNKDLTNDVLTVLNSKKTKANEQVLERVNQSEYYEILANDTHFLIHSQWHNHKYEIARIAKIVGLKYAFNSVELDKAGLWQEWVKLA